MNRSSVLVNKFRLGLHTGAARNQVRNLLPLIIIKCKNERRRNQHEEAEDRKWLPSALRFHLSVIFDNCYLCKDSLAQTIEVMGKLTKLACQTPLRRQIKEMK